MVGFRLRGPHNRWVVDTQYYSIYHHPAIQPSFNVVNSLKRKTTPNAEIYKIVKSIGMPNNKSRQNIIQNRESCKLITMKATLSVGWGWIGNGVGIGSASRVCMPGTYGCCAYNSHAICSMKPCNNGHASISASAWNVSAMADGAWATQVPEEKNPSLSHNIVMCFAFWNQWTKRLRVLIHCFAIYVMIRKRYKHTEATLFLFGQQHRRLANWTCHIWACAHKFNYKYRYIYIQWKRIVFCAVRFVFQNWENVFL